MDHIKQFTADLISGLSTDATLHLLAACLNQLDKRADADVNSAPIDLEKRSVLAHHAEVRKGDDGWSVAYWAEGCAELAAEEYDAPEIPEGFAVQPLPTHWPPRDMDTWLDRNGREWVCRGEDHGDGRRYGFRSEGTQITVDYLVETAGPLRLVAPGWERNGERAAVAA